MAVLLLVRVCTHRKQRRSNLRASNEEWLAATYAIETSDRNSVELREERANDDQRQTARNPRPSSCLCGCQGTVVPKEKSHATHDARDVAHRGEELRRDRG